MQADTTTGFNKKEIFRDTLFGVTLWDMTTNFGFQTLDDGKHICYQNGESYYGVFFMRGIFQLHSLYVSWACERHINSEAFANERLEQQAHTQTQNIPLHVLREFVSDLAQDVRGSGGDVVKLEAALAALELRMQAQSEELEALRTTLKVTNQHREDRKTQIRLVVSDPGVSTAIKAALDHISEAESNKWTLRTVTPTWVDGNEVQPASQAWTALLEACCDPNDPNGEAACNHHKQAGGAEADADSGSASVVLEEGWVVVEEQAPVAEVAPLVEDS